MAASTALFAATDNQNVLVDVVVRFDETVPHSHLSVYAVRQTRTRATPAANFRCPGCRRGTDWAGGGDLGSADEQSPWITACRCRRHSATRVWMDHEPGRDLPVDPARGAQSRSHLACAAGRGAAQC